MSLDVYLTCNHSTRLPVGSGIFIRDQGQTVEISQEEWNRRNPDRQIPVLDLGEYIEANEVYHANITHNLGPMAEEAGIYKHLWRPEEIGVTKASQLIEPLREGLAKMQADPVHFKSFEPENKWGTYDGFVPWISRYIAACEEFPDAEVTVSR